MLHTNFELLVTTYERYLLLEVQFIKFTFIFNNRSKKKG
jgi:hypothetical protein